MIIPTATYRLQFRNGMTFERAQRLVPHLKRLGVSHLYASPIFTATRGSTHGYDVIKANEIEPSIGGREGFERLVWALKASGIGLILDIVPNHMAASLENPWWRDVVEKGERSRYARHFDIDWSRKLTLPFLGDTFEKVLEENEISVKPDTETGKPAFAYYDTFYPLHPASYDGREAETIEIVDKEMLARLHEEQPYRLMSWREASRDLSYRRFFEITGLVGLRVEDEAVFEDTHCLILELVHSGAVEGLRVDHVDGLADPKSYLERLRREAGPDCYIVVEKILGDGERIPPDWPISGTTGYEFITALSHVLVDGQKLDELRSAYELTVRSAVDVDAELRAAKLMMADKNFATEFTTLLKLTKQIRSRGNDGVYDQPDGILAAALRELLISFPVYRTYGTQLGQPREGQEMLISVLDEIQQRPNTPEPQALSFLLRILTGDVEQSVVTLASNFRTRFQQLTGPLMAKSVEDTLFFRHHVALGLNEVGADPLCRTFSLDRFHQEMQTRLEQQPNGLSATSTHDTKRGEDARARLYTITEAPQLWADAVSRWRQANRAAVATLDDGPAPEPAVEWMLYQALFGAWPPKLDLSDPNGLKALEERFIDYVEKAIREAKLRTNWGDSNQAYEAAVIGYARHLLSPQDLTFLKDFAEFIRPFVRAGLSNSISQTVIKLTAPGIPDIYQGSESLNFSLVDPDNRAEPDFELLQKRGLETEQDFSEEELLQNGGLKQHVITVLLHLRQQLPLLFATGSYVPLLVEGDHRASLVAYARADATDAVIVVAGRLGFDEGNAPYSRRWQGVKITLPDHIGTRRVADVFTRQCLDLDGHLDVGVAAAGRPFFVLKTV